MIDIHHHCLPGVDDGPRDWDEAVALCQMAAADGITTIVATPHVLRGRWQNTSPAVLEQLAADLRERINNSPRIILGSDRMKHLIHEIRAKFAFVIFDSPPVMAVTDSIVLAANADGVVLCVHGGHTPRDLVQRAAERLRQSNIPVLGALLNNLDLQQYGYTYKKSYYDYYDNEAADKREAKGA